MDSFTSFLDFLQNEMNSFINFLDFLVHLFTALAITGVFLWLFFVVPIAWAWNARKRSRLERRFRELNKKMYIPDEQKWLLIGRSDEEVLKMLNYEKYGYHTWKNKREEHES